MQNRRQDRNSGRSSNQRNLAAEDARNRFQDQDYDQYFPKQNQYHPRMDQSQSQSDWRAGQNYGSDQNYSENPYMSSTYGSDNQMQRGYNRPSQFSNYEQSSNQSWSQPVRNDEAFQSTGKYFGKGPRGFKRSDERIREDVCEALYKDHAIDASEIEVTVNNGEVTLRGTVESRQMKRLAEDCVETISGVSDVKNEIKIQSQTSSALTASQDKPDRSEDLSSSSNDRSDKTKGRSSLSNSTSANKLM